MSGFAAPERSTATAELHVTRELVDNFARLSGDDNPLHVDAAAARDYGYARPVAHGALLVAALSKIIGTQLPGRGALWMNQSVDWLAPVFVGDRITLSATVRQRSEATGVMTLEVQAVNQDGVQVMTGEAQVKQLPSLADRPRPADEPRVALVVGGSRGIGAAIVRRLAGAGCRIVINGRSASSAAAALRDELTGAGRDVHLVAADVTSPGESRRLAERALADCGRLDIVVHCATPPTNATPLLETPGSRFDEFLRAYVGSTVELVQAAAPAMARQRFGRFIQLGTSYLFGPPPAGLSAYVVAKSAAAGLIRSVAAELGPMGITANMVSPGMAVTDLTAGIPARVKEVEARRSPARRLPQLDEIADLVAFLASDAAGYISGQNIALTGGPV